MKLLSVLFVFLLLGIVAAQDSVILPGWETREPGYNLRVMSEGEGDDSGPYHRGWEYFLNEQASDLGFTCARYEKLVWRKQHATIQDLTLFRRSEEHESALRDQFNSPITEAFGFSSFNFRTTNPVILGTWGFVTGEILKGDTEDTLYFIYHACRAL